MQGDVIQKIITVLSVMGAFGLPSIAGIIGILFKIFKYIDVLQRAQKAQMRSQLLSQYDKYMEQGYIEQIYLDDWMNQYKAYHLLVGDNEVLEVKKKNLLALPSRPVE